MKKIKNSLIYAKKSILIKKTKINELKANGIENDIFERTKKDIRYGIKLAEENIGKRIKIVEDNTNNKLSTLQVEIEKFREMNKVYAQLLYEVNNANAKFRFNDGCYFEAILEELKNIYHVTTHKDSFSKEKFDEISRMIGIPASSNSGTILAHTRTASSTPCAS